jgi:hypothetical protein
MEMGGMLASLCPLAGDTSMFSQSVRQQVDDSAGLDEIKLPIHKAAPVMIIFNRE